MILWTKEYEVLYALVLLRAVRLKQDGKNFEKKYVILNLWQILHAIFSDHILLLKHFIFEINLKIYLLVKLNVIRITGFQINKAMI